jgi:hypothetical protein
LNGNFFGGDFGSQLRLIDTYVTHTTRYFAARAIQYRDPIEVTVVGNNAERASYLIKVVGRGAETVDVHALQIARKLTFMGVVDKHQGFSSITSYCTIKHCAL